MITKIPFIKVTFVPEIDFIRKLRPIKKINVETSRALEDISEEYNILIPETENIQMKILKIQDTSNIADKENKILKLFTELENKKYPLSFLDDIIDMIKPLISSKIYDVKKKINILLQMFRIVIPQISIFESSLILEHLFLKPSSPSNNAFIYLTIPTEKIQATKKKNYPEYLLSKLRQLPVTDEVLSKDKSSSLTLSKISETLTLLNFRSISGVDQVQFIENLVDIYTKFKIEIRVESIEKLSHSSVQEQYIVKKSPTSKKNGKISIKGGKDYDDYKGYDDYSDYDEY
jgi:hypothetical protein